MGNECVLFRGGYGSGMSLLKALRRAYCERNGIRCVDLADLKKQYKNDKPKKKAFMEIWFDEASKLEWSDRASKFKKKGD